MKIHTSEVIKVNQLHTGEFNLAQKWINQGVLMKLDWITDIPHLESGLLWHVGRENTNTKHSLHLTELAKNTYYFSYIN